MFWIALYVPESSLQIAARGIDDDRPMVVSTGSDKCPVVLLANKNAANAGIMPGHTISASCALVNNLLIVPCNPDHERDAIYNFASWSCQFTPSVSLMDCEGLLLEVGSTLSLHGGLSALLGKLRRGCFEMGYQVTCGVAPTPLAAWLFAKARHHGYQVRNCQEMAELEGFLADLPLALLDWPLDTLSKLSDLGIISIAECLRLPAGGFVKRFGEGAWIDLQRALGRQPDPRLYFVPADNYHFRAEFGFEVNEAAALLFPLKRLLIELEGALRGRSAGILECHLILEHSGKRKTALTIGVAQPERKCELLLALAREHLDRCKLPASVIAIGLEIDQLHILVENNSSWLPDPKQQSTSWYQLLDKLTARLGKENVYRIQTVDDFRPECAWKIIDATAPMKPCRPKDLDSPRPLFLLPSPRKLHLDNDVPLCRGKLHILSGPERIEYGWWDGRPVYRDYYVGRNPRGETMWLFRDHKEPRDWHLHGYFS